ncbi:hypothetical protein KAM429_20440 [Aquipseudomonas alcaligenes]|jgi:hypothetical protein|uniref:Uncharacterized protein n=2 Tax=Aquipseudomonas alcaligenes TaxID=43263 RepID=A0AA37FMN6_AQUAC|nr:hypothetical protein KAM426_17990 [Pseudomonas alcaligenes]GIZ66679.1 hypothetical protein KAM428_17640 [Pseudomonas alcaligenes]GIZ71283.1 hypothetical protein KAM429_20440 [Pseudomonas alcaligenes]GIZ75480.1 hypothetical protein KAM430_18890 [Pseudomonas alcaligenes]GIZ79542.1 hypothetical protein KAM432_15900 [Pseudomonas alcaligenes]
MPPPGFAGAAFLSAPRCQAPPCEALQATGRHTNKNKGRSAMWKQAKYRQATLIVLATTVILILPNVTRLVS